MRPDTRGFTKDAEPGVAQAGESIGGRFSRGFVGALSAVTVALGAIFAGQAVISFVSDAIGEAREAVKVQNLTNAVLKSTGQVARVTAADVEALADRMSTLAGVDDEVIQGAENLLLTFTNIRNAAGKNNNIFDQATEAIVDMTAAMNKGVVTEDGLKSATIQVGKALNDPIKGITALTKVGVTFTAAQKDQIKSLVASGKTMEAQKIILAELRTEFGGAAAAAADPAQRAAVAWANFKETIGELLLPAVNNLFAAFSGKLIPYLEERVVPVVRRLAAGFSEHVVPALRSAAEWVQANVLPRLRELGTYIEAKVVPIVVDLARRIREDGGGAFNMIKQAIADNRPQLEQFVNALKDVAQFIVEKVLPIVGPLLSAAIKSAAVSVQIAIVSISMWVNLFNVLKQTVIDVVDWVRAKVGQLMDLSTTMRETGRNIVRGLWDGVFELRDWLVGKLKDFVRNFITDPVKAALKLGSPSRLFAGFGVDTVRGYAEGIRAAAGEARAAITDAIPGLTPTAVQGANITQTFNVSGNRSPAELAALVARELTWNLGV